MAGQLAPNSARMTDEKPTQTHAFQAEVAELLHLMVHSVYSETDIFLRELISNASDACDKLRYEAIAKPELLAGGDAARDPHHARRRGRHADDRRHRHRHGPPGADRQSRHRRALGHAGLHAAGSPRPRTAPGLIGQFGVGFYSAFMVADRIEVTSRRAGAAEAWVWTLVGRRRLRGGAGERGAGGARAARHRDRAASQGGRRSAISSRYELERIVRTYSDHILFPDRAGRRQGRGAPDQCRQRAVAARRSPSSSPRTTPRPIARSPAPSTSRR